MYKTADVSIYGSVRAALYVYIGASKIKYGGRFNFTADIDLRFAGHARPRSLEWAVFDLQLKGRTAVFLLQGNKRNRDDENRDEGTRGSQPFGELEGCSSQAGAREFHPREHRPHIS